MNWPMYTYTVVLSRNLPYLLAGEDVEQIMITEFKMWNGMSYDKALFTRVSFQLFRQATGMYIIGKLNCFYHLYCNTKQFQPRSVF